jgi:O-antigen ligase
LRVAGVAAAGALAVLLLADPQFIARQATTVSADDNSAQSRFTLWAGGVEMIKDYPLGLGGRGYHALSPQYATNTEELKGKERSSHNTYIQVATDWGIQGLVLFLAFIGVTIRILHRVRRETISDWLFYRSLAIEMGLIATLLAGFFSSRFYGESIYWLGALAVSLHRMQNVPHASTVTSPAEDDGGSAALPARPLKA